MKRRFYFTTLIILTSLTVYSQVVQDTIIETNGKRILCVVQREDSTIVYFSITRNDDNINTFLDKSSITSVTRGIRQDRIDHTSIGVGWGFDYGGFGANLLTYPQRNIGLFVGVGSELSKTGYNLVGYEFGRTGYNLGIKLRFKTKNNISGISPYIVGMYGYNSRIFYLIDKNHNKIFNGTTIGFGIDFKPNYTHKSYCTISLLFPFRSTEANNYIRNTMGVETYDKISPFFISTAYRFVLNK